MLTDFCTVHKLPALSAAAAFFCCFLTVGLLQKVSKRYILLYTQNSLQHYAWGLAKKGEILT